MIDPSNVPAIGEDETLARYVLQRSHIRHSNQTVKPDAFIPHPYPDLSVSRHLDASEDELWAVGKTVADAIRKTLYGRGDIHTAICLTQKLTVHSTPVIGNTNHAEIRGWPKEKPMQKIIAQELAATSVWVPHIASTQSPDS